MLLFELLQLLPQDGRPHRLSGMDLGHGIRIPGVQKLSIAHWNRQALLARKGPAKTLIRVRIAVLELANKLIGRIGWICFKYIRVRRYVIAHSLRFLKITGRFRGCFIEGIILIIAKIAPTRNVQKCLLGIDIPGQAVQ